jgi:predicted CopG family antitoxin
MVTTIQISEELLERLKQLKIHEKESYEDLLWDIIEDRMELSDETIKNIKEYEKDMKEGNADKFVNFEDIKKRLRLNV